MYKSKKSPDALQLAQVNRYCTISLLQQARTAPFADPRPSMHAPASPQTHQQPTKLQQGVYDAGDAFQSNAGHSMHPSIPAHAQIWSKPLPCEGIESLALSPQGNASSRNLNMGGLRPACAAAPSRAGHMSFQLDAAMRGPGSHGAIGKPRSLPSDAALPSFRLHASACLPSGSHAEASVSHLDVAGPSASAALSDDQRTDAVDNPPNLASLRSVGGLAYPSSACSVRNARQLPCKRRVHPSASDFAMEQSEPRLVQSQMTSTHAPSLSDPRLASFLEEVASWK